MRRWRKKKEEDDDVLKFDNLNYDEEEDEDDDEEDERPRRRYVPPRPIRTRFFSDNYDDANDGEEGSTFEDLEPMIRAGKYKPKPSDPYTAHILYQNLVALGEIG